jgi:hypothetical protein
MATYVKSFNGYIADVPLLWFKRCDGKIFYFDELTQASITANPQFTEINAGWSTVPVAYLPGQSTFEMQITSGKFEADLFAMTNATSFKEEESFEVPVHERLTVSADKTITLTQTPKDNSVSIGNLTSDDMTVADKVVTLTGVDAGTELDVNYITVQATEVAEITNKSSAVGEAVLKYPVYASGDDCTEAGVIGYALVKVYKARVTAQPGLDGSYKSASTFQFTLSAMDAKRADEACYAIAYIRN